MTDMERIELAFYRAEDRIRKKFPQMEHIERFAEMVHIIGEEIRHQIPKGDKS